MNPTDKATYENANSSEINDVYSDDQVTVDKKIHARARGIKYDKKRKLYVRKGNNLKNDASNMMMFLVITC